MSLPKQEELPVRSNELTVDLDEALATKFNTAFNRPGARDFPPTVSTVTINGIFEILDELKVDWRGMIHISQKFEYLDTYQPPVKATAFTELTSVRQRSGAFWLKFVTHLSNGETRIMNSESLIMLQQNSGDS